MSHQYRGGPGLALGGSLSTMVRMLIAWNVILFLVQLLSERFMGGVDIERILGLIPREVWRGHLWQLVTYMFLHGGFIHIFFNMFALWMFGSELEYLWGPRRFLTYYFFTGIGAGITNAVLTPNAPYPIIGASGAVYGLLLAFGMYFPNRPIYLYFLFPIPAKVFVIIFGALEFFSSFASPGSGVAHIAHLGGLLFGFLFIKDIPMRWLRSGRRGGGRRGRGARIYDIRQFRDREDQDSRWK